jgi:hypothetical protein
MQLANSLPLIDLVALDNKKYLEIERARGLNPLGWRKSLRPAFFIS